MRKFGLILAGAAGLVASMMSGQAYAVTCTTTTTVPTNTTEAFTALGTGVCVQAGDKLFGNFTFGNLPVGGSVLFAFGPGLTDPHTLSFIDSYVGSTDYNGFGFQVAVAAGNPGVVISDLVGDFNLTAGTGTLHKITTPVGSLAGGINCSRTFGGAQTCPETDLFSPGVLNLAVADELVTGAGFIGSAVIDTI